MVCQIFHPILGGKMNKTTIDTWGLARLYVTDHSSQLGTSLTGKLLGHIRARRLDLVTDEVSRHFQSNIHDWKIYKILAQVEAFFKKNESLSDPDVCFNAAKASFERAEKLCRIANRRLAYYYDQQHRLSEPRRTLIRRMRFEIARVLGPLDSLIGQIPDLVRVTSGATSEHPRSKSFPFMKMGIPISVSEGCMPLLDAYLRYIGFRYPERAIRVVGENRIVTVPKNWKTYRSIAAEPTGSLPFQLAVDGYLKTRLRWFFGVDLRNQRQNQELARKGSLDGSIATVDLSMASDTLPRNLIAYLFPEDWTMFLNRLRTPRFSGDFGSGTYAKFSSMGNGCTFTLETLVFGAACKALGSELFSVYGDDICIEADLYDELVALLGYCGFVVNEEKSFSKGPFRESCGSDYFEGHNVRPYFVRKSDDLTKPELCHLINGLVEVSMPYGLLWTWAKAQVTEADLLLHPWHESTQRGVFITPSDAYNLSLIRNKISKSEFKEQSSRLGLQDRRVYIQTARGYVVRSPVRKVRGLLPYRLWFVLRRYSPLSTSEATDTQSVRFKVRPCTWIPPRAPTPPWLYAWSDFLLN
jgi:hypothetical protein